MQPTLDSVQGGLFGSVSWAAMLMLSTVFADIYRKNKKMFALSALFFCLLALSLLWYFPVSKNQVSSSYALITISAGADTVLCILMRCLKKRRGPGLLLWWGANPLLLYVSIRYCWGYS